MGSYSDAIEMQPLLDGIETLVKERIDARRDFEVALRVCKGACTHGGDA